MLNWNLIGFGLLWTMIANVKGLRSTGADPGFDWGAQIVTGLNCQQCTAALCERSEPFSAWGLGPILGPWKLLGISLLNMHSLHFGVPFILFLK